MDRKLKILWCGEASYLNTGYAVYAKEVLGRLYKTDKYEIAELGSYSYVNDDRKYDVPWKLYPNMPTDEHEQNQYNAHLNDYEFGSWRFEDVCLDFKPDIVLSITDWWMQEYQERSPFRDFYHWAIMPTVDSYPQQEQYLSTYMNADTVFSYSEFGKEVLEKESSGRIKISGIPSPGADYEVMKPVSNKTEHRSNYGFSDDITIVGTVMRNQTRKLYPKLIPAFKKMLLENPELEGKTYLYIHCAHPDRGWDIPKLIRDNGMGRHTLFTYVCHECKYFFPMFFQDARTACPKCGKPDAQMPGTQVGVDSNQLAQIYNWFDLYIQYSVCEGFGMPQVEAAACGIPFITVNYSAMESVGKNLDADLVELLDLAWDAPTQSLRAIPNDEDLIKKMLAFIKQPKAMQLKRGIEAHMKAKKRYNWDDTAKQWENFLDTVEMKDHKTTWLSAPKIYTPNTNEPQNLSNEDFVRWGINNILCQPEKSNSYMALRMLRDLNYGRAIGHSGDVYHNESSFISQTAQYDNFSRNDAKRKLLEMRQKINDWERKRVAGYEPPLAIQAAKPDDKEI